MTQLQQNLDNERCILDGIKNILFFSVDILI